MALRDEFIPYTDGNNLLAPGPVAPTGSGSDNGPMYTSEWYVMLQKSGQLTPQDLIDFQTRIGACVNSQGMLCRVPVGQNDGQEQVDDYLGVLNACKALGNTKIPRQFLLAIFKNLGFMDNVNPGSKSNWAAFMPRQLQLMAAMVSAAFPSWKNPLHILIRWYCKPLFIYAAIIIATSCIGTDPGNTDARRLSWHLQNNVKGSSILCRLAAWIWTNRLKKDYLNEMQDVAAIYYQPHPVNPYSKYWIT
jgi:hypothetical protein